MAEAFSVSVFCSQLKFARPARAALIVVAIASFVTLMCVPTSFAEDWPSLMNGPSANAKMDSYPGRSLGIVWESPVMTSQSAAGCVVKVDDRVYVVSTESNDPSLARVVAVNTDTGAVLWSSAPFRWNIGCVSADSSRVYVTHSFTPSPYAPPGLTAFSAVDGSLVWDQSTVGTSYSSPPTVVGSSVYESGYNLSGNAFFALNASTGVEQWSSAGFQTETPPVIANGAFVQRARSGDGVFAVNASTGSTLWTDSEGEGPITSSGDDVFYRKGHPNDLIGQQVVSRDAFTGALNWAVGVGFGYGVNTFAADLQRVYVSSDLFNTNAPDRVVALDHSTGAQSWITSTDHGDGITLARLGDALFAGNEELDPTTGAIIASTSDIPAYWFSTGTAYADGRFFRWEPKTANTYALVARGDVVPPNLAVSRPQQSMQTKLVRPTFSWINSDGAGTGVTGLSLSIDAGAPQSLDPTATSFQPSVDLGSGNHTFSLTSTDGAGNSTTVTRTFSIVLDPHPVAQFGQTPATAFTNETVTFDASASHDSDIDGTLTNFDWDLDGDGSFETSSGLSPHATKTFSAPYHFTIGLRVTNDSGNISTTSINADVRATPSAGEVSLSVNDGAYATNNRIVELSLVWPKGAISALVSNDGGFGPAGGTTSVELSNAVSWTLRTSGQERIPKTVYARFKGAGIDSVPYTDDIILDTRNPAIFGATTVRASSLTVAGSKKRFAVRVRASDDNSGVSAVQVAARKRGKSVTIRVSKSKRRGARKLSRNIRGTAPFKPKFVRALDAAGNASRWVSLK